MLSKIILVHSYDPIAAASQRMIAYAKAYRDLGLEVVLVFYTALDVPEVGIECVNCIIIKDGKGGYVQRKYQSYRRLISTIKKEYIPKKTVVQFYAVPLYGWLFPKSKYFTIYERTEVPFYGNYKSFSFKIKEKLQLWLCKRANGLFVISQSLKTYYQQLGVQNVQVINMFVDNQRFENVSKNNKYGDYIAYCGTITKYKDGVDCLIKAFQIFKKKNPNFKLLIIGRGVSDSQFNEIKNDVKSLGLNDSIVFTGPVSAEEMPSYLSNAKILALARPNNLQAKYGFPTKLGEYLSTGNPIVVTNVGEIHLFLKDKDNCILAQPDNPTDFAEKLQWVEDNYDEALLIGKRGMCITNHEFSAIEQCKKALKFLNQLLQWG